MIHVYRQATFVTFLNSRQCWGSKLKEGGLLEIVVLTALKSRKLTGYMF